METTTYTLSDVLSSQRDAEAMIAGVPASFVAKGMFFSRLRVQLGDRWPEVQAKLDKPPRMGRFIPFNDYPQSDYMRMSAEVALKLHPDLPLSEGLRRVGRADFQVFGESTFGKVTMATVGDVRKALYLFPGVYPKLAPGDYTVTLEELDQDTYRLEIDPTVGSWEYQLGQAEGVIMHYDLEPRISVTHLQSQGVRYDIHL